MKRLIALSVGLLTTLSHSVLAQAELDTTSVHSATTQVDPASITLARTIVDQVIPPSKRTDTFMGAMANVSAQLRASMTERFADPGLRKIVFDELDQLQIQLRPVTERHIPAILDAMARAYPRDFSIDELKSIAAFATTPTGSHYLSRSSAILGDPDVAAANIAYFKDPQAVQDQFGIEVQRKVQAYVAEHTGAAPKP